VRQVGARVHTEHWIPAEELPELNRNLVGLIEVIASFERTATKLGGELGGDDRELEARPSTFAVFPGIRSARAAARRLAGKLSGATTQDLVGGSSLVDARRGDRRVTITCPPSTAYLVELYDGGALVAAGHTLEDTSARGVASAWLGGTLLDVVHRASPFMRPAPPAPG
jgi:hypothetical protein